MAFYTREITELTFLMHCIKKIKPCGHVCECVYASVCVCVTERDNTVWTLLWCVLSLMYSMCFNVPLYSYVYYIFPHSWLLYVPRFDTQLNISSVHINILIVLCTISHLYRTLSLYCCYFLFHFVVVNIFMDFANMFLISCLFYY